MHSKTPYITRPFTDVRFAVDSVAHRGSYIEAHPDFNDGHAVATLHGPQHEENAAFMVRACNHHHELIEALRRAIQHVPANAVNMEIALHSPIADARTLDYCKRVLAAALQSAKE